MRRPLLAFVSLSLAATASAQVLEDYAVRCFTETGPAQPGGLELLDVHGDQSVIPIAGLSEKGRRIRSALLDPATGDLYLGGEITSGGEVRRVRIVANAVVEEELIIDLPAQELGNVVGLALDGNGNLFACDTLHVVRWERGTGEVVTWDDGSASGHLAPVNGIAIDPLGRRMWTVTRDVLVPPFQFPFGSLAEYDLTEGPGPAEIVLPELPATENGDAIWRASLGELTVAADFGIWSYDPSTARTSIFSSFLGGTAARWDPRRRRLHAAAPFPSHEVYRLLRNDGSLEVEYSVAVPAFLTALELNAHRDVTTVFPLHPSATTDVVFEVTAHAARGELAGVFVAAVNGQVVAPIELGLGRAGADGFLETQTSLAGGTFPAGTTVSFTSARLDGATGLVVIGSTATATFE